MPAKTIDEKVQETMKAALTAGTTYAEIAKICEVNPLTVQRYAVKWGLAHGKPRKVGAKKRGRPPGSKTGAKRGRKAALKLAKNGMSLRTPGCITLQPADFEYASWVKTGLEKGYIQQTAV